MMDFKEMTIEALEERRAAIAVECEAEDADLDSLEAEARSIKEELEARKAAEAKRVEIREAVANGAGTVIETVPEFKEERKMFERDSMEYRNAWLKTLQGKELNEEERAGYTQGSTYATHAIPTIVADKFFEKMKKLAPMLSEITLMRVAGNLQFVAEGTRNPAAAHTENSALTAATDTTVAVTLGAVEFVKIVGISKSASMMSTDAFEDWLVEMLAGDIARAIDNYILNGASNGIAANTYTTSTNQILNTNGYGYADVCNLIALLPAAYDAEAKFVMNKKTLYGQIAQIVDSTGNPIFVPNTEDGMKGRIMGYPVLVDDYVTTTNNAIYLGAFKNVVGNLSEGPEVDKSLEAGFTSASILYRGYASFDSKLANSDAVVRLVTTA